MDQGITPAEHCPESIVGITPFHMAAENGHITRLLQLLAHPMHSLRLFILANYGSLTNYLTVARNTRDCQRMKNMEQLCFTLLLKVVNWQYLSTYFKNCGQMS